MAVSDQKAPSHFWNELALIRGGRPLLGSTARLDPSRGGDRDGGGGTATEGRGPRKRGVEEKGGRRKKKEEEGRKKKKEEKGRGKKKKGRRKEGRLFHTGGTRKGGCEGCTSSVVRI